ncbi:eukaryotic translation initiation factor 4B isoform X1 [Sigmodon hispidus]
MDRYGGRDRYDDRGSRDYDREYDSRIGSGRRAFGSGYRRDDDYRGGGDRYEVRYDRRDDRSWNSRDDYSQDDYRHDDRGNLQRPKLNLKPRSTPKEDDPLLAPPSPVEQLLSLEGQSLWTQLPGKEKSRSGYRRSRRSCSGSWMSQN